MLRLRRNLGHQRAIVIALAYVEAHVPCAAVVVMDLAPSGEDRPSDVVRLADEWREANADKLIFALRSRRSEGPAFRAFYGLYRALFKLGTGQPIRVGNFSLVPRAVLRRLVAVSARSGTTTPPASSAPRSPASFSPRIAASASRAARR